MKLVKLLLLIVVCILIVPIFSLFILSITNTGNNVFEWYKVILENENFSRAFLNSITISAIVSLLSVFISTYISLSYFGSKEKYVLILIIIIIGLMPADVIAISINKMGQLLGLNRSNIFFLIFSLILYCLPFTIIILWIRYYFIDVSLLKAGRDLGLNNTSMIKKIIIPLSKNAIINVFLFSFLLTFNEFTRTYYLSGSTEYLSEYLNGKLSSGTDNSIYAGATISILITIIIILVYFAYNNLKVKKDMIRKKI